MKVAGYIRVSTEQQKQEGSHENQRDELEDWATEHDHEITFVEDIAISGQSDERTGYQMLMNELGEYDAVVVRELSRFGRSLRQILNDIHEMRENNVDFISLNDDLDTGTAQGKLLMHITAAFNEYWANIARERANEMVQRRREEGKPIGRPKKLGEEQLEEVFEWREKGLSYNNIAILIEDVYGVSVDGSTIYRYCKEEGIEPEVEA